MKILKDAGSFEILTPREELLSQLLRIEKAGRTCYQSIHGSITKYSAADFIRKLLQRGHESVIEHSWLSVRFFNVSRGFSHEMVRHRLCAFSQESTRYVDYAKRGEGVDLEKFEMRCVVPPHQDDTKKIELEDGSSWTPAMMFAQIEAFYRGLRKAGWPPQDARQILPIGMKTELVVSANFREWRHIFQMRTQKAAHWEIRGVMGDLLEELQGLLPVIFDDFTEAGVDSNGLPYFEQEPFN